MNIYVFFLIVVAVNAENEGNTTIGNNFKMHGNRQGNAIFLDSYNIKLMCMANNDLYSFDKFNKTLNVKRVVLAWCMPPKNNSYNDVLNFLNINVTNLKTLHLMHNTPLAMSKIHFTGLKMKELYIENEGLPLNVELPDDFLELLDSTTSLVIDNVVFPPLPEKLSLNKIILKNGMPAGKFGDCSNLEELHLIYWLIPNGSQNWLGNCSKLLYLKLEKMPLTGLTMVLKGLRNIQNLTITRCDLIQIPHELLLEATNLRHLEITYNYLQNIRYDELVWLESLTNLITLDLSQNELITGIYVFWMASLKSSKYLRDISIAHNPKLIVCRNEENPQDFHGYTTVTIPRFSLAFTGLTELCFKPLTIENLEYLDLMDNSIKTLTFEQLPRSNTKYIVDLRRNPLHETAFRQKDYENFKIQNGSTYTNATVLMDSLLDCDCRHGWFAKALREEIFAVDGAICTDNIEIKSKPPELLECDKTIVNGYVFRESWKDKTIIATCSPGNVDTLPGGRKFKKIYAADNDIEKIQVENLPPSLQFLDLQKNSISRVDEDVARILFNNSRHLLLRGNPILCNCNNKFFIEQLQKHRFQVDDYDNLTCAGEGLAIREVIPEDLCYVYPLIPIIATSICLSLLLLSYIIYRIYGQDIKMFLFTHGWCLCCVREEDLDSDRDYDAFLSFSHQDYQFVNEQLLEVLEKDYKLCLHFRDWLVGEWIPIQIQLSIQKSKRTIIVLSQDFLRSIWGMFEFRMAFALAMKEGRSRIILIVIDDVIEADMPPDLRHFVSNNTYLEWGDPWFWQKIRYALPHKIYGSTDDDGDGNTIRPSNEYEANIRTCQPAIANGDSKIVIEIVQSSTPQVANPPSLE